MRTSLLWRVILPALLIGTFQQGCDLSTPPPTGVALPGGLDGPEGLPTRLAAAIGDFAVAYGGNTTHEGLILVSGLMADELRQTIGSPPNVGVDRRAAVTSNELSEGVYRDLQQARASAEEAIEAYRQFAPHAVGALYAWNLAGFSYTLLAEAFCDGVPFSHAAPDGSVIYGEAETTNQALERAVSAFDTALALSDAVQGATDSVAAQIDLARIGRARALLGLERFAEAGEESAQVSDDFRWVLEYSKNSPREVNGVYDGTWGHPEYSAVDSEGVNGIGFLAAGDPRVQVDTSGGGSYAPIEYSAEGDPIVLARSEEARLIEAEALFQVGDLPGSVGLLNALRASIGLAPLAQPATPDAWVSQLFRERAFWLWLTGHRLGDLRRLVRQYSRSSDAVYPTGSYGPSGVYGTQLSLPVHDVNNPRYDTTACDPSRP